MKNTQRTKKKRLLADLCIMFCGCQGVRVKPRGDDSEQKFETTSIIVKYRGNNLAYEMLYEPISSDNEDKEGGKLNGNCLINLQNLTRSVEKVLL